MSTPFVLVPMCDCFIDEKSNKKTCISFLRAFVLDGSNIKVVGDFDHNSKHYVPVGEVSSESKCCDCHDCRGDDSKTRACYDIRCLLRNTELNGGLANLQIVASDGTAGAVIVFDPPAVSMQTVTDRLNSIGYLGYENWTSSGSGFLCVEYSCGSTPPGQLTSCRFKRFTLGGPQANWPSIIWYTGFENPGVDVNDDIGEVLNPNNLAQDIADSHIHYFSNIEIVDTVNNINLLLAPANRTNTRLFRTSYSDQSSHAYIHLTQTNSVTDVLAGLNITTNYNNVINALPAWFSSVLGLQSVMSLISVTPGSSIVSNFNNERFYFSVSVDLPCKYSLLSMGNLMAMSALEVNNAGIIAGTGLQAGHKFFFSQVAGVGTFVSTPSINGVGGTTNTDINCNEVLGLGWDEGGGFSP
jgi:hypothetical protein